jgi:hydrogenase-4 component B
VTAILPMLGGVTGALLALGLAAWAMRGRLAGFGTAGLCAVAGLLALAAIVTGGRAVLALPIGLPGSGMVLALDPLSAFFLLPVCISGFAAGLGAAGDHAPTAPMLPVFVAAMILTLLAADALSLMLGFELMSVACWVLVLTHHEEKTTAPAAQLFAGMAVFGAACLLAALAVLAAGPDLRFEAMRAVRPDGIRAVAVLVLVLLGAGSKAGLAPLHPWLPLAHPAAPSHVSALMSGAMTKVAIYVIIRVLFDLCGPATPGWWGAPLLVMGAASAVLGGLRANVQGDLKSVLAASTIEHIGFITIGLGVSLAARGADLAPLASLALGGAMLHVLNHGTFKTLAFLSAGAAQHGAGTRSLDRLGGLIHRMPVTTACMLVAAACLAALPPMSGFASEWVLFQSVLAAPRIGGLALQTTLVIVASLMALAAALGAMAAVRLVGIAFLGRPRSPRAAAAEEAPATLRATLIGLAALCGLLGLLPGAALALTDGARQMLSAAGLGVTADWTGIAVQADAPGYAPLGIAAILLLCLIGGWLLVQRLPGSRRAPAWACGFAAAPAWLPFGDPATQYTGLSLSEPLVRTLGGALIGARETVQGAKHTLVWADPAQTWINQPVARGIAWLATATDWFQRLTLRRLLSVVFAALVLCLIAIAWVEAA